MRVLGWDFFSEGKVAYGPGPLHFFADAVCPDPRCGGIMSTTCQVLDRGELSHGESALFSLRNRGIFHHTMRRQRPITWEAEKNHFITGGSDFLLSKHKPAIRLWQATMALR